MFPPVGVVLSLFTFRYLNEKKDSIALLSCDTAQTVGTQTQRRALHLRINLTRSPVVPHLIIRQSREIFYGIRIPYTAFRNKRVCISIWYTSA